MSPIRCVAFLAALWCSIACAQTKPSARAPARKPPAKAEAPAKAEVPALRFQIGQETQIEQPGLVDGHFILYVPRDYTPDRAWPVIFCYHGINQSAKVWPFKELTEGKEFIVIGMSYTVKNGADADREFESLVRIGKLVAGTLNVNPRRIFIGGFSLGGMWTYRISAKDPTMFAGVAAFGMSGGPGSSPPAAWQGKPVLVAHGETDQYCQKIQDTLDAYGRVGAQLTHEVFPGQGHTVDTNNQVCKKWFRDNGPRRALQVDLEAARAVEKAGKLGAALKMYEAIAKIESTDELVQAAKDAAKALAESADKKFAEVEEAVDAQKLPAAIKTLQTIERMWAGTPNAEKARARRTELHNTAKDEAKPAPARADTPADAAKRMEKECKAWTSMADGYIKAGAKSKAKPILQRIIDTYPDSPYAAAARRKLAGIP